MDTLHPTGGRWPAVYPLRGGLGQTQYTQLRPSGELATESALFIPSLRHFRLLGVWPADAGLSADIVVKHLFGEVLVNEVLVGDVIPMSRSRSIWVGLDDGALVVRQGPGAIACVVRGQVRDHRFVEPW